MPDQRKLSRAILQSWPIRKLSRSDGAAASPPPDHIQFDLFSHTIDEEQGIVRQPTRTEPKRTMSSYKLPREHRQPRKSQRASQFRLLFCFAFVAIVLYRPAAAVHHMKRAPIAYVAQRAESSKPLVVENLCQETIYPGMATQAGDGPGTGGFRLGSGAQRKFSVSADWQGRVWARTNCSFNALGTGPSNVGGVDGSGAACVTGDCFGVVNCVVAGKPPTSLAEFTLATSSGQTFYDISLVDGYNIPIAIVSLYPQSGNSSLQEIPPNLTNPICVGTASLLADEGATDDATSGTNSSFPIPLEQKASKNDVQTWCPWNLQLTLPNGPRDGVYSYPDGSIQRAIFNPCYSACAKYNKPSDCCTGGYDSPNVCKPSTYSMDAKKVCPDAYSFAFDDQTSTFIIPSGGGFQVTFCPEGRSSNIIAVYKKQLTQLSQTGHVSEDAMADMQEIMVTRTSAAARSVGLVKSVIGMVILFWLSTAFWG